MVRSDTGNNPGRNASNDRYGGIGVVLLLASVLIIFKTSSFRFDVVPRLRGVRCRASGCQACADGETLESLERGFEAQSKTIGHVKFKRAVKKAESACAKVDVTLERASTTWS